MEKLGDFWGGVGASILATIICRLIAIYFNNRGLNVVGTWGEELQHTTDNKIAVGIIYFDRFKNIFIYKGTCYTENGDPYSDWDTVTSYYDKIKKKLFYVFSGTLVENPASDNYGLGVVHISKIGRKSIPTGGYYISPPVDYKVKSHSMFRVDFTYDRSTSGYKLIEFMKRSQIGRYRPDASSKY